MGEYTGDWIQPPVINYRHGIGGGEARYIDGPDIQKAMWVANSEGGLDVQTPLNPVPTSATQAMNVSMAPFGGISLGAVSKNHRANWDQYSGFLASLDLTFQDHSNGTAARFSIIDPDGTLYREETEAAAVSDLLANVPGAYNVTIEWEDWEPGNGTRFGACSGRSIVFQGTTVLGDAHHDVVSVGGGPNAFEPVLTYPNRGLDSVVMKALVIVSDRDGYFEPTEYEGNVITKHEGYALRQYYPDYSYVQERYQDGQPGYEWGYPSLYLPYESDRTYGSLINEPSEGPSINMLVGDAALSPVIDDLDYYFSGGGITLPSVYDPSVITEGLNGWFAPDTVGGSATEAMDVGVQVQAQIYGTFTFPRYRLSWDIGDIDPPDGEVLHRLKVRVGNEWRDACPRDEDVESNGGELKIRVNGGWVQARDYLRVRAGNKWIPIHEETEGGI